jgi:hypothetical protein
MDILRGEGYGGRLPGFFLAGYRPFESITVKARPNNRRPISNPIQERLAQPGVGKDLCPFLEWQIGGNDRSRSLGSFADDLKHQLRADLSEGDIAHLINGDQVVACPSLQSASELVIPDCFNVNFIVAISWQFNCILPLSIQAFVIAGFGKRITYAQISVSKWARRNHLNIRCLSGLCSNMKNVRVRPVFNESFDNCRRFSARKPQLFFNNFSFLAESGSRCQ